MSESRSLPESAKTELIDRYLRDLRRGLGDLPAEEVDDIVREIASHLSERIADPTDEEALREKMATMEPASDLAAQYRIELP